MDAPAAPPRLKNPWWMPPFLGTVPEEITPHQLRLLGFIALALLFENYDLSMLGSAMKYIRESFGLEQAEAGRLTAYVRLGAIPAFFVIPFVDRLGRRRVFLTAVIGMSLGTLATAFTQTEWQFIAAQMVSRTFLTTAAATAFVIVSEELPAARRGWGVGMLAALGAFGFGLGAILFAVIHRLPYGWRALYVIGVVPLLLVPAFRREIRETQRFERTEVGGVGGVRGWLSPILGIVRDHPWRALGLALVGFFGAAGQAPPLQLMGDYLLTDRHWEPWHYSALFIGGGLIGIIGNPAAGRLGDRLGRRKIGFWMLALFPLFILLFYRTNVGWLLPILWIPAIFVLSGANTVARALSTELFPTSSRGTATGAMILLETLGAAAALAWVTVLTPEGTSIAWALGTLSLLSLVAAAAVLCLPETAGRELEQISAEPPRPAH